MKERVFASQWHFLPSYLLGSEFWRNCVLADVAWRRPVSSEECLCLLFRSAAGISQKGLHSWTGGLWTWSPCNTHCGLLLSQPWVSPLRWWIFNDLYTLFDANMQSWCLQGTLLSRTICSREQFWYEAHLCVLQNWRKDAILSNVSYLGIKILNSIPLPLVSIEIEGQIKCI